jgi:hypothetical protein
MRGLDSSAWSARRVAARAETAANAAADALALASPEAFERAALAADSAWRDARDLVDLIDLIKTGAES